ncbi:hypothetical protein J3Q09_14785 [Pseudomonas sp. R4-83]|uniref:hypothetical protein n=1 Tax=unclassified Pseudomonas TaxID=196821 RepID=UPI003DA9E16D
MNMKSTISSGQSQSPVALGRRSRFELRSSSVNVGARLADPEFVGLLAGRLLPKTIIDSGTAQVRFLTSTIVSPEDNDEYELYQRKGAGGTETKVANGDLGTVAGRPAEVLIPVPTAVLLDDDTSKASTTWQFQLIVYKGSNGNPDESQWITLEIDRNPPEVEKSTGTKFQPERATFLNLPGKIVNDDWLANNEFLQISVNRSYDFYNQSDTINIYSGATYGTGVLLHTQNLTADTVEVPSTALPKVDAREYLWYTLTDLTGNLSELALANDYQISRTPAPKLHDCIFPQGISPDQIDLNDVQNTVHLNVTRPDNAQNTDRIAATVTNGTVEVPLGNRPLGTATTLQFPITTSRLLALWADAAAAVPITGSYKFYRGTEPEVPSANTTSAINLLAPGPDNPGFPDIKNPNMVELTVVGESTTANHITASDRLADITLSTPMIKTGDTWVPVAGDVARFWINGAEVADFTLTVGNTDPLSKTMTPAEFDAVIGAPGIKQAYWTIENDTISSAVVESLNTSVQVDLAKVDLDAPTVQLYNDLVSCRYLTRPDRELPVTVPIDTTHMPKDTVVTVYSQGYEDELMTKEVLGTDFSDTYTVLGTESPAEFVLNVKPYLTKLKPIQPPFSSGLPNGYIKIWYSILISGAPNPSEEFSNEVSLLNSSNNYCEGTPTD